MRFHIKNWRTKTNKQTHCRCDRNFCNTIEWLHHTHLIESYDVWCLIFVCVQLSSLFLQHINRHTNTVRFANHRHEITKERNELLRNNHIVRFCECVCARNRWWIQSVMQVQMLKCNHTHIVKERVLLICTSESIEIYRIINVLLWVEVFGQATIVAFMHLIAYLNK